MIIVGWTKSTSLPGTEPLALARTAVANAASGSADRGSTIRDERDYAAHMGYIHFNQVKHGLVRHAAEWPYSTLHRAVLRGLYPKDWDPKD